MAVKVMTGQGGKMNNRLPGVLGHLGFILCLVLSVSGEATAQTLEDALTSAYRNNPTLLGQRAKDRKSVA